MKIILYQPEIPQNTGNIVRTCSVTGSSLILVKPLGFRTSHRSLKRAGLDYWENVSVEEIDDLVSFLENTADPFYFFSSKAKTLFTEKKFSQNSLFIFGSETKGLPPLYSERWPEQFIKIPMRPTARCLNLSNAAAIAIYEALRQQNFSSL